jgi:hypothetical protein
LRLGALAQYTIYRVEEKNTVLLLTAKHTIPRGDGKTELLLMNQSNHPTQMSDLDGTLGSTGPATHTNPFSADLKGEFSSNFGTNTNAVSQILGGSGYQSGNNNKMLIIMGVVVFVLVLVAAFIFFSAEEPDPFADLAPPTPMPQAQTQPEPVAQQPSAEEQAAASQLADPMQQEQLTAEQAQPSAVPQMATSGSLGMDLPVDGDIRSYDETAGPAVFSWQGPATHIIFSRSESMSPTYIRAPVSGSQYEFYHPYPGTWYWQLEGPDGLSEVRRFRVEPAQPRNVMIQQPTAGGTLAGSGGVVTWAGDTKVAFYRVEFSAGGSFAKPDFTLATSGTSVQTQGIAPGAYQMRVGAFSEVSGKWEYTAPVSVTVQ